MSESLEQRALRIAEETDASGHRGNAWAVEFARRLMAEQGEPVYVIFDGPPSHDSVRFVEVETKNGKSISVGEWENYSGKYWRLGPLYASPPQAQDAQDAKRYRAALVEIAEHYTDTALAAKHMSAHARAALSPTGNSADYVWRKDIAMQEKRS